MNRQSIAVPMRRKQTAGEEIANAILHGMGALFAVAGLVLLIMRTQGYIGGSVGGIKALVACVLYAATLIILFLASTLYHAVVNQKAKQILRIFDHSAIYLLIAGTYTPICLLVLPPVLGLSLTAAEWGLAIAGIVLHTLNFKFIKKIEIAIYFLMGWALAVGGPVILRTIPATTLILIAAGGLMFSLGVLFYKKHEKRFFHAIWHIFVLAGTALQWTAVYLIASSTALAI